MRFFKPLKGFRSWNTLGVLFFSATLFAGGFFQESEAFAQEAPLRPPRVTRFASAKSSTVESLSIQEDMAGELKEKVKGSLPVKSVRSSVPNRTEAQAGEDAFELIEDGRETNNFPSSLDTATIKEKIDGKHIPKEVTSSVDEPMAESLDKESSLDSKNDSQHLINSTIEPQSKKLSEPIYINVLSDKDTAKEEAKLVDEIVKAEPKEEVKQLVVIAKEAKKSSRSDKIENREKAIETKKIVKKVASKVSKKVPANKIEDETSIPEGWDWFSSPLVFKEAPNGKIILVADKNAPKIVIGKTNTLSPRPYEIPLAVVPVIAEEYEISEQVAEDIKLIPSVAPAQSEIIEVESTDSVIDEPLETESVKGEIRLDKKDESASSLKPFKGGENNLFAEAVNKMAAMKKLRNEKEEKLAKDVIPNSPSMIRLRVFVKNLIAKEVGMEKYSKEAFQPNTAPQAPPAHVEAEEYKSESDDSSVESSRSMSFVPYIGRFGPNRLYFHFKTVRPF